MRRQWHPGCGARAGALALAAALLTLPAAQAQDISPITLREDAHSGKTHILAAYYQSGMARLSRGDPAGARRVFETASAAAPAIPQVQAALAAAILLADFTARERALPAIRAALAAEPREPLYRVIEVLADPASSTIDSDGALGLTAAGAAAIDDASSLLATTHRAYNAEYLALLLDSRTRTGDPAQPERLPGFAALLAAGSGVTLPRAGRPLSLGRLFELVVPDAAFKPYEVAFVEQQLRARAADASLVTAASQR